MNYIIGFISLIIGIFIGHGYREIIEKLKEIDSKVKEPEVKHGVVRHGVIVPTINTKEVNDGSPVRVVKPKSPKQIEIEEDIKFRDGLL